MIYGLKNNIFLNVKSCSLEKFTDLQRKVQYVVSNRLQISTEQKIILQNRVIFIVMTERFFNLTVYGRDSQYLERFTKAEEKY
jgi:hypothetical protein